MQRILLFALLAGISSCNSGTQQQQPSNGIDSGLFNTVQTGGIQIVPIQTAMGTFNIWTKQVGNNPSIKVLLLNGGPGATHEYFECFESFFPQQNITFIYYDQLGCGRSDHPTDSSFWSLPRFVEEVEQVRQGLHLDSSNFYLLGHSWGGILAMQYALKYQQHLKGLIVSNMMSSCPAYGRYADSVLAPQFDPVLLDSIRQLEKAGDFGNPRYMGILQPNFYTKHICRLPLDQWPEPVNRSFAAMNQQLYVTMQGPSEFGIAGRLANWDVSKELPKITVPTLTIGGKHDTMDPEYMKWMSTQVKNGSFLFCPEGSHLSMYDDQVHYFPGLIQFIQDVNNGHVAGK